MQGRFTSDQYRAVSGDDLLVLKAVWMCVVAPRTETLHLENGHNGDTDAESLYLTTVSFPVPSDLSSVTRLENYIAPEHSKVYIVPDKRRAIVYVDQAVRPRQAIWLRVISAIPMLLPWLFEGEQKLQPDEYALLQLVYKISQKDNAASRKDFWGATAPFITKYAYDMIEYRSAAQEITVNAQADRSVPLPAISRKLNMRSRTTSAASTISFASLQSITQRLLTFAKPIRISFARKSMITCAAADSVSIISAAATAISSTRCSPPSPVMMRTWSILMC